MKYKKSKEIDDFAIIAPISDKKEYPNYILKKDHNFDKDSNLFKSKVLMDLQCF